MVVVELMVPVEGGSLWVQDTRGDGVPAVLLHPGWGDTGIWDAVVEPVCGAGAVPAAGPRLGGVVWACAAGRVSRRPAPPPFGRLAELAIPTRLFLGDLEYPMVADSAAAAARQIPGCELTTLEGADHLSPL